MRRSNTLSVMLKELIEAVRSHKVLFDTSDPDYQKSKVKDQIWSRIAVELHMTDGNAAKSIWIKLRNSHRDALRRQLRVLKSGTPAAAIKQWKFQRAMEFLMPYMTNRLRDGNLDDDSEGGKDTGHRSECTEQAHLKCEALEIETVKSEDLSEEMEDVIYDDVEQIFDIDGVNLEGPADEISAASNPSRSAFKSKKRKKVMKQSMQRRVRRVGEGEKVEKSSTDHLYHFYMSMYEITKQMPSSYQHIVRNKVFHAVTQAEAECLQIDTQEKNGTCSPCLSSLGPLASPKGSTHANVDEF